MRSNAIFVSQVRFTKLMYSQLLHKKLEPAASSNWKYDGKNGISKKANDMGYKLVRVLSSVILMFQFNNFDKRRETDRRNFHVVLFSN